MLAGKPCDACRRRRAKMVAKAIQLKKLISSRLGKGNSSGSK